MKEEAVPLRRATVGLLAFASTALVSVSVARAGNGDGVQVGNEAAMTGGAVSAVVRDGTATWYNPAGLASMQRDAVDVSGSALQLRAAEEPGLLRSSAGDNNDGGYLELISIPSAVTFARRLEPGVAIAFGIFAPGVTLNVTRTGLDTSDGLSRTQTTLARSQFRATYHAGGAIGFRVSDQLRFGVSLFGVYREVSETFQTATVTSFSDGSARIFSSAGINQVRSFGLEIGLGMQWEPHPGTVIAVTARSPGLEVLTQIRGSVTELDATATDDAPDVVSFVPSDEEALAPGLTALTAGRYGISLAQRFDRGWIAVELDVQPPIELDPVVDRRFVWNVRAGGRVDLDDNVALGAGIFTDMSPGRPITELAQTQVDFYGATIGFEYRSRHRLGEGERSPDLIFSTTGALRYALGVGQVGGLELAVGRDAPPTTIAVATTIHEIGIHLGSALYF